MAMMIIGSAFSELRSNIWKYILATVLFLILLIPCYFLRNYPVLLQCISVIVAVIMCFVYFSIYLGKYNVPKNLLSLIAFSVIQSVILYLVNYCGGFLIGYFFYYAGDTAKTVMVFIWSLLTMLLTIPFSYALFKVFKDELSLKEAFGCFVDFYRRDFWKKILLYIRVILMIAVVLFGFALALIILGLLCEVFPPMVFILLILMLAFYMFYMPFMMTAVFAYFEECELYENSIPE